MKTYFKKAIAKTNFGLVNTEDWKNDWRKIIQVKIGETYDVKVEVFEDGRTYYTAFRIEGGIYYCNTIMRGTDGKLYPNCGGMSASRDIPREFEAWKKANLAK